MTGPVEVALAQVQAGLPVVVVDAADREGEADLVFAAEHATPELLAFVVRHTSGYVCVALDCDEADRLELPPMCQVNEDRHRTAYALTVDARDGIGTGISAIDRAHTIRMLAQPTTSPHDLTRPGHVVPLRARPGGVLTRAGHTEAARDLAFLAGLQPAAGLAELVSIRDPLRMADATEAREFAAAHGLALLAIADLIAWRQRHEPPVRRVVSARVPLVGGGYTAVGYQGGADAREHVAFVLGEVTGPATVPVSVHVECLLGDVFRSALCGCGTALAQGLDHIAAQGRGVVIYVRSAARRLACAGPLGGMPTDPADLAVATEILRDLGVTPAVLSVDPLTAAAC